MIDADSDIDLPSAFVDLSLSVLAAHRRAPVTIIG